MNVKESDVYKSLKEQAPKEGGLQNKGRYHEYANLAAAVPGSALTATGLRENIWARPP